MVKQKNLTYQPIPRGFYAWNSLHAGSFLLFVEAEQDHYKFIFLPGPSYMCLTKENFTTCIETNVLEFVEELPEDIYKESLMLAEQSKR